MIDKDDYEIWLANPVTEQLHRFCFQQADEAEKTWHDAAWTGGNLTPELRADLSAMARVLREIPSLELEDIQPEEDHEEQKRDKTD